MKTQFPKIKLPFSLLVVVLLGAMVTPVLAGRHKHRHHHSRSYHSRSYHSGHYYRSHSYYRAPRVSVGIYSSPYYRPYYRPYYAPYYAPAPVVYGRPVTVVRPVTAAAAAPSTYEVQRELAKRGYYGGTLDGQIGPRTRAAIRTYQVDRGLPVTGQVDGNLLRSLRLL